MNKKLLGQIVKWGLHLAFCLVFLCYFSTNSFLRPSAYPHVFKEIITGILALFVIYLNYILLFPLLFVRRKYEAYFLLTFFSIFLSGAVEMLIVHSEIMEIYLRLFIVEEAESYFIQDIFSVSLRNAGWVVFFIMINAISLLMKQEQNKEKNLRQQCDFLDVYGKNYSNSFISTKDIYYCVQVKNVVTIYTNSFNQYFRYCSMVRMEELLGSEEFIRISRNAIVSKKYLGKYGNGQLELRKINKFSNPVVLPVGKAYEDVLLNQIQSQVNNKIELKDKEEAKSKPKNTKIDDTLPKSVQEEFEHNPKLWFVYQYVMKNPNSNVNSISDGCRVPKGTVRRYVSFLMENKLVEHSGSKRYGGYSIAKPTVSEV